MSENGINFNLIVFGGDGDLACRKIYPAIYHRIREGQFSASSNIVAVSRNQYTADEFHSILEKNITKHVENVDPKIMKDLFSMTEYISADLTQQSEYKSIKESILSKNIKNTIFYFSTPSSLFLSISESLKANDMIHDEVKIVLEKPLGHDLASFEKLNSGIRKYFKEKQIFRIDHYLGKETVQNLMVLRFANHIFELAWNANYIDNVQITVAESIGVEQRKNYYDQYGALKDMVQNHLLQLLCLVAMEPPAKLNAHNVRDEKLKVLKAVRKYDKKSIQKNFVRAQYTRGEVNGVQMQSYQEDIDRFDSTTETFVAMKVDIDNWRWAGVPFYLRTGKRMTERYSEIVINFKRVPHNVFPSKKKIHRNKLIIRLQPEESIQLVQMAKEPGPGGYRYKPVSLELDYADSFDDYLPDAYERLLADVVRGIQTLFMREDELRAAWEWTHSILDNMEATELDFYKAGTMGTGDKILNGDHYWHKNNTKK